MPAHPISDAVLQETADTHRETGFNVSATARVLGIARQAVQHRVHQCVKRGFLSDEDLHPANTPKRDDYMAARLRKMQAFERKAEKGDWRQLVPLNLPGKPFRLKVFGDPHLDDDGCDFELFERHFMELSPEKGVYGMMVGDYYNNWTKSLAHLFKEQSTPPSDSWLLFEYLMQNYSDGLLAACSGNHDDWSHAPVDPIALLMRQHGVAYRTGAIRLEIRPGNHAPITIAMRHKWRGRSQYSHAHGMIRGLTFNNWYDNVLIGGHIHVDEARTWTCPETGRHATICQVSAFKSYDLYADVHGFAGAKISPVWDLVIDPSAPDTDPDKVKVFYDSARAQAYLEAIR